jgi:predicted esterase
MKRLFIILGFLITTTVLTTTMHAQGILRDTTINFMGEQRAISIYIPSDYSPSVPAKLLVGLHGLGDTDTNYMNALVYLFPESTIPNTIIICPDGGSDANKDFYTPEGDEAIIDTVISFAKNLYNIDVSEIVLQGFSLGGRSALKFGLDFPEKFKALLLNTPAVQGTKDAVFGNFLYANASKIPIYITCGNEDLNYLNPIDSMRLQLVLNDGKVLYRQFSMGHSVPYMREMTEYQQFIDSLYISDYDLDVVQVKAPVVYCETPVPFSVLVQNKGSETLTDITFTYKIGSDSLSHTWTGNLAPFQHLEIGFPDITVSSEGYSSLTVEVEILNSSFSDSIKYNNSTEGELFVFTQSKTLPYEESFSTLDFANDWSLISAGDYFTSFDYNSSRKFLYACNTIWIFDNSGRKEETMSPALDLSSISNPSIAFDVAYMYTLYNGDFTVGGVDVIFADTLEVSISTDCGETFDLLYKKGGEDLLTFNNPLINLNNLNTFFTTFPSSNDWRREWIDLSPYAESTSAFVKFSYVSALGGLIFLDNIAFSDEVSNIKGIENQSISVYPNPVKNTLYVQSSSEVEQITIYDISGRLLKQSTNPSQEINVSDLANGVYIVKVKTGKGESMQKIIKQ